MISWSVVKILVIVLSTLFLLVAVVIVFSYALRFCLAYLFLQMGSLLVS